jgi:hypothetical protein
MADTATIGFEQQLWATADILRGNANAIQTNYPKYLNILANQIMKSVKIGGDYI